ncbi:MAG: ATP-binding protein [Bacteroidales bacterium]|nr:ATP-binding protein [Bacteroidales bacterium]
MYSRLLINQLHNWKNKKTHKPLVIRGARQVGKSTLVREFGKEFDVFIEVNLEVSADAEIFRRTDDVEEIWRYLCLRNHAMSNPDKCMLLFIDEIQEEPLAVGHLRYFYEKMPWLYVITAGSRLHSLMKKRVSFPVSRVEYLNLRPFTFCEYLAAMEGDTWANAVNSLQVTPLMHEALMRHFNRYALVGGMPEAVATYADTRDIVSLSPIFNSLLKGYNEDVERYAKNEEQVRIIRHILETAWFSAGETVTFSGFGGSSYTSTQIHDAMNCLEKAYLLSLDYPVTTSSVPALPAKRRSPKLITVDLGITNFAAGIQTEYMQSKDLLDTWRGRAAEQIVAQELRVLLDNHYREGQYFWLRDKKGTTAEVDYVWQQGTHLVPIEVKAGTNSHFRSLHSFVNHCESHVTAIRVWSGEFGVQDIDTPAPYSKAYRLINVPFYYVGQLDKILNNNMA